MGTSNSKIINLTERANAILELAEKQGVEQNFFFITTFQRYQVQIQLLQQLETQIRQDGTLVEKEYVKGRRNVYTHPAVGEYNRTCTAANQTVTTLMKIIQSMGDNGDDYNSSESTGDELLDFLRGRRK